MKISNKQLYFIGVLERCGGLFRHEVNKQLHPDSMVDALIAKGLIAELEGKLTSVTSGVSK